MIVLSLLGIILYLINNILKGINMIEQYLLHSNYCHILFYIFHSFSTIVWCKLFFLSSCFPIIYETYHYYIILTLLGGSLTYFIPDQPNPCIPNKILFLLFLLTFLKYLSLIGCSICSGIILQYSIDLLFRSISIVISQIIIYFLTHRVKKRSLKKLNEILQKFNQPLRNDYDSPSCTALIIEYSERIYRKVYRYMKIISLAWHMSVYFQCWMISPDISIAILVYLMKLFTNLLIEILTLHMMYQDEQIKLQMIHPLNSNEFDHLFEIETVKSSSKELDVLSLIESCPICLSSQGVETIKLSSCGHMFHEGCILAMMRHQEDDPKSQKCPICRQTFTN